MTIEMFPLTEITGDYSFNGLFGLVEGKEYTVFYDDVEYHRVCYSTTVIDKTILCIGEAGILRGYVDGGDQFVIYDGATTGGISLNESGTHTIRVLGNFPVLAPQDTWYSQGGTTVEKSTITEIEIKDSYTPAEPTEYLSETTITGEIWLDGLLGLKNGSTYKVMFDEVEYICQCQSFVDNLIAVIFVGNGSLYTAEGSAVGSDTGEPFVVAEYRDDGRDAYSTYIKASDGGTHTISVSDISSITDSWDASVDLDGSVTAYIEGTKLILAGDGSGCIYANENSRRAFAGSNPSSFYTNLTTITGLELLDTSKVTNMRGMFQGNFSLVDLDVSKFDTSNVTDMYGMFQMCTSLLSLDLSSWDVGNATNISGMFYSNNTYGRMKIQNFGDISKWNTSKVTEMKSIFYCCSSLTSLDLSGWDTSACTNMSFMFEACEALTDISISDWETKNVETMERMFMGCKALQQIALSNWDTSSCKKTYAMFRDCSSLQSLDLSNWNTQSITDMKGMFYGCKALTSIGNIAGWDTSNCTDMSFLFGWCHQLAELDVSNFDTSSCTKMDRMFAHLYTLDELNLSNFDTSMCTDMSYMFSCSTGLTKLDLSNWDVSNVTTFKNMFSMADRSKQSLLTELNVANWDTSSCTDMSFMFFRCNAVDSIDVSSFDVSGVTTFDNMFAESYATVTGLEDWVVTNACTNMTAMFHSVQNDIFDVSNYDTSNVASFEQMFEECTNLTKVVGIERLNTSQGLGFGGMFCNCGQIKELNLSGFDTTKAKDGAAASVDNSHGDTVTRTMQDMFNGMISLEKITLGENFSFTGDGTTTDTSHYAVLPTPSDEYIPDADGNWYTEDDVVYVAVDIPSLVAATYYAVNPVVYRDYLIKGRTLLRLSKAIQAKTGIAEKLTATQMIDAINSLSIVASDDDDGNVTLAIAGFSTSDDDAGNIDIS